MRVGMQTKLFSRALFLYFTVHVARANGLIDSVPPTCEGASQLGYRCERHEILTEDGYILGVFRLSSPQVRNCSLSPVLLQHGFGACYTAWLISGPSNGLGYMMADAGYDVWLTNSRGTAYSQSHINISSDDPAFWDWSYHEMGHLDLPATVDYVLMITGYAQILFVGQSMGNNVFFVMCTTRPEYNSKVEYMIALGPTIFLGNSTTPLKPYLASIGFSFKVITDNIFGKNQLYTRNLKELSDVLSHSLLKLYVDSFNGADEEQWDEDLILGSAEDYASGTSFNTGLHLVQGIESGKFQQLDYGLFKNLLLYNSSSPPSYDLTLVSTPMTLFVGDNDFLASPQNVETLLSQLHNDVEVYRSPHPKFCHVDFLWAKDVKELVNDVVLSVFASKTKAAFSEKCIDT